MTNKEIIAALRFINNVIGDQYYLLPQEDKIAADKLAAELSDRLESWPREKIIARFSREIRDFIDRYLLENGYYNADTYDDKEVIAEVNHILDRIRDEVMSYYTQHLRAGD